jgi:hypothetical protein
MRIQDLTARFFAARAIAQMREHEVATLAKRITLALNPPAPIPSLAEAHRLELVEQANGPLPSGFVPANWRVESKASSLGENIHYLVAVCEKCSLQIRSDDPSVLFKHCSAVERVPAEIAQQLRRAQGKFTDSDAYAEIMGEKPATPAVRAQAPVREKVSWFVESQYGELRIKAQVPGEFMAFSGLPKDAVSFHFHGEQCPQSVIEEYTRYRAGA